MEQVNNASTESITNQDSNTELVNEQGKQIETESKTTENTITLTPSELDRLIGERTFKALEKERKKQEETILKEKGDFEKLSKQYESELHELKSKMQRETFRTQVIELANKSGLNDYADILNKLPDIESVNEAIARLSTSIDTVIQERVQSKLHTRNPVHSSGVITSSEVDIFAKKS